LTHTQTSEIQAAAMIEVELGRHAHDALRILCSTELHALCRHSADDAHLDAEDKIIDNSFFACQVNSPDEIRKTFLVVVDWNHKTEKNDSGETSA
jgi:hypothetical protein